MIMSRWTRLLAAAAPMLLASPASAASIPCDTDERVQCDQIAHERYYADDDAAQPFDHGAEPRYIDDEDDGDSIVEGPDEPFIGNDDDDDDIIDDDGPLEAGLSEERFYAR